MAAMVDPGTVSVSRALSSPTRASIFDHLRAAEEALTVRDVADVFDLHPNVARSHLSMLADAGLVTVGQRKHAGGGRPARVYRARPNADLDDRQAALDSANPGLGGAAAALMVRLLVRLLDATGDGPLVSRAHRMGREEGHKAAVAATSRDEDEPAPSLSEAAHRAVAALRPYAPDARVARAGSDWAEIVGISPAVALVERNDPALAEALERGLLAGALEASGPTVELTEVSQGTLHGRSWRVRRTGSRSSRQKVTPAATLDARGRARDAGVVEAMRAITRLGHGDVLEVLAEGPGSPMAFARWADRAGHALVAVERAQDATGRSAIRLLIEKA